MDNLLFIIGIAVMVISTIIIVRAKRTNLEGKQDLEYIEKSSRSKDYKDEMDFTEEEVEFISNFEPRERVKTSRSKDFDRNFKESSYDIESESVTLDEAEVLQEAEATGEDTDKKEAIAILYREGLTPSEIAKRLEMGRREVDIILKVKGLVK